MFDLNPMDVIKERELTFLPIHFSKIFLSEGEIFNGKIKNWINVNLKGRYCLVKQANLQNGKLYNSFLVGFEESKELTYFILACPHLRRTQ